MKKLFILLISLLLCFGLACGIMVATGVTTLQELADLVPGDGLAKLRSAWKNTTQMVLENGALLYNQLADHKPPTGDGHLLEGDLPEDKLENFESLYEFPEHLYPYRAMLTGNEQLAYDQAYANAMELYDQFPLHTPISTGSIMRVMSAVFYDHPELFWLETAYQYSYTSQDSVVAVTLSYNDTARNIAEHQDRYGAVVRQVVAEAGKLDTAVQQEKYVHDFLLDNVSYRLDAALNQSAYSALIYGESVCAGYARAFQHIMIELGIPTYYCAGYAGEAHAWNIVRLDDGYYHVDIAWDDPLGNESGKRYYNYFNLTDTEIAEDHTRTDLSVNLPACNGTAYSYDKVFGVQEDPAPSVADQYRAPEEAGMDRRDAIATLPDYYAHCEERLVELGAGAHSLTMLIEDQQLLAAIFDLTQTKEAMEHYAAGAAQRLGFDGYSVAVSLQAEPLTDGYWLLTQQVQLAGQVIGDTPSQQEPPGREESREREPEERREALPEPAPDRPVEIFPEYGEDRPPWEEDGPWPEDGEEPRPAA